MRFWGGYGGSLSDNNTLALAMAMGVPLGWYAKDLIRHKMVRLSLVGSVFLTVGAVVFTYSRGGTIALAAGFVLVVLHSRRRVLLLIGLAILTLPSVYLVRDTYTGRMETLDSTETAEKDRSVRERMETVRVASLMWEDYPLIGVGFGSENQRLLWFRYADTSKYRAPLVIHNTYLQMLVDSGSFALLAYLALLGGAVLMMERSARRLKRAGSPLYSCPLAIETGLVVFAVGSTFLTRVTFDFAYLLLMMGASWLIVEPGHLASLAEARERDEAAEIAEAELAAGEAELSEAGA
jgi:probable O-glycosylation ligase (exosortase A-associated)